MPITPERLIQIAKSKGVDTSKYEQQLAGQGQEPRPKGNLVTELLDKISPKLTNTIGDFSRGFASGTVTTQQTDLENQYKQAQIDALKNRQNTLVPIMGPSGEILGYQQAPQGNVKFAPVGYSPAYQERAIAGAESARAGIPLKQAQTQNAQQAGQLVKQVMDGQDGQVGNIPPGTTVTSGGITVPINPKLTESEQGVIGGVQGMEPMLGEIEKSLNSGVLESPMGNVGRTLNQILADRQSALFTANNPKLQDLQSQLNALKKTIPFTEGGKQLTQTEKAMVMALLNISGKPNDRIMKDLNQAMQILRAKEQLAIGGRNYALNPNQQSQSVNKNTQQFNSPEEADASGLPTGTIVSVNGRPYEIG